MTDSKSMRMKKENARRCGLSDCAKKMYLDGKVSLCRSEEVSKRANKGSGWV